MSVEPTDSPQGARFIPQGPTGWARIVFDRLAVKKSDELLSAAPFDLQSLDTIRACLRGVVELNPPVVRRTVQHREDGTIAEVDQRVGLGALSYPIELHYMACTSLRAAIDRYRRGCPDHGASAHCDWFQMGRSLSVLPEGWV